MALPFIVGLALGAGAVIAYNKRDMLKEKGENFLDKAKESTSDIKDIVIKTKDKLETKIEELKQKNSVEDTLTVKPKRKYTKKTKEI